MEYLKYTTGGGAFETRVLMNTYPCAELGATPALLQHARYAMALTYGTCETE